MAKPKKAKAVELPPIEVGSLKLSVDISLQTGKPMVAFEGEWKTKDVKTVMRAIPRMFRLYQVNRRKQNEARFTAGLSI